eukprot:594920-Rhodomonas_salina.2
MSDAWPADGAGLEHAALQSSAPLFNLAVVHYNAGELLLLMAMPPVSPDGCNAVAIWLPFASTCLATILSVPPVQAG